MAGPAESDRIRTMVINIVHPYATRIEKLEREMRRIRNENSSLKSAISRIKR